MAHTILFPINGICFTHESCHNGGVVAFAMSFRTGFVGTLISEDAGVIVAGQSNDQSSEFGGRDFTSATFLRCSRKMGILQAISIDSQAALLEVGDGKLTSQRTSNLILGTALSPDQPEAKSSTVYSYSPQLLVLRRQLREISQAVHFSPKVVGPLNRRS